MKNVLSIIIIILLTCVLCSIPYFRDYISTITGIVVGILCIIGMWITGVVLKDSKSQRK